MNLYSGAIFIQQALRWSLWWSVLGILAVTVVTTVLGGLAAVIYTDTLQFFIMIIGSLAVMAKGEGASSGCARWWISRRRCWLVAVLAAGGIVGSVERRSACSSEIAIVLFSVGVQGNKGEWKSQIVFMLCMFQCE